jgi:hypothetical protein
MYDAGKEPKKESFSIEETTGLGDERMLLEVPILEKVLEANLN